jgi:ADP-ribosylglycohydrolase
MIRYDTNMLRAELAQRGQEGCDAKALEEIAPAVAELGKDTPQDAMAKLYDRLDALEPDPELSAREPSELEAIRSLRPDGPRRMALELDDEAILDRILGAWLGRAAGCLLGKPVEGWSRADIRRVLEHTGEWPLQRYFPPTDETWDGPEWHDLNAGAIRRSITRMARDDDMDYTLLGLVVLEKYGPGFTTEDVAREWLLTLPYHCVYTAEREAYRNLVLGIEPPESATYRNPYREWIGAQIRADMWGYVAPGNPELAAELAWRDARVSHVGNGIYGEMWMAATIAAAFVVDDPGEAMMVGLGEIPAECRLAEAIRNVIEWHADGGDGQAVLARIDEAYGHYYSVHTINNAALVALGLLAGGGELGESICVAVAGSWDTDCNGASVGSVIGAMSGANPLPYEWVGPLNDTLVTALSGVNAGEALRFSGLAQRTLAQARRVREGAQPPSN